MSDDPKKMELSAKRDVPLSLYTFIVRPGTNVIVPFHQNISLITAYSHEEAFEALRKQYPAGQPITVDAKGALPITQVLDMFNKTINFGTQAPLLPAKREPEVVARTKRDFYKEIVEGMIKDAGSFTNNEQDKTVLLVALHKMLSIVQ